MKSFSLLCIAVFLSLASTSQAQTWNINYGNESGKVAYYNSKSDPNFAEDSPYGPMSFRVIGDKLWVLDSIAGKIHSFDKNGKIQKSIVVPNLEGFKLLEDFALVGKDKSNPEAIWVANAADCLVRKISIPDGKVLAKVGGNGNEPGKILQVNQIDVDDCGRLYVADIARNTISVFSSSGVFQKEYPWQSSGFVVDKNYNLHLLYYSETSGYFHRIYSEEGQLISNIHLGFIKNTNVKILSVDKDNSIILSMIPKDGFKGTLNLIKLDKNGLIKEKLEYIPTSTMNRDVCINEKTMFQAEADFESAPTTKFIVKPLVWEKKQPNK